MLFCSAPFAVKRTEMRKQPAQSETRRFRGDRESGGRRMRQRGSRREAGEMRAAVSVAPEEARGAMRAESAPRDTLAASMKDTSVVAARAGGA